MNMHKGARLTPYCRALLVKRIQEHGLRVEEAAQAAGVSVRTAYKWLHRFRSEGRGRIGKPVLTPTSMSPCHPKRQD